MSARLNNFIIGDITYGPEFICPDSAVFMDFTLDKLCYDNR